MYLCRRDFLSITFSVKRIAIFMIFAGKFDHDVCFSIHNLCKR